MANKIKLSGAFCSDEARRFIRSTYENADLEYSVRPALKYYIGNESRVEFIEELKKIIKQRAITDK